MKNPRVRRLLATAAAALVVALALPATAAQAYTPTASVLYQLGSEPCLKGRGNCIVYPKTTQLPSGRLIAAFEKSTVVSYPGDSIGGAIGQTMPIWKSDDNGTSWQPLSEVAPPSKLSADPAVAKYSSNWTNPYLYVLPQTVGDLTAGTLLLASVVSGEDEFYREKKAADPNWVPSNDGDRRDVSIALYASTDEGGSWRFVNMIAQGGWQGGSAGAGGVNISAANTSRQQDPLWEPHLMVRDNRLVAYYSDENDFLSYDQTTGAPALDPNNATARDSGAQILVHRTWDGRSSAWGNPVVDVAGDTFSWNGGQQIGGGRPGMTTVANTVDGRWFLTFEYFGGGDNVRYKIADDPLRFFADGDPNGTDISQLPVTSGSARLATGGSPVLLHLPDGRIAYNASGSGDVWINDGASFGAWTQFQTTLGGGYSRNLQHDAETGRLLILQSTWGGASSQPVIRHADIDFGRSLGDYVQLVNRKTGQVLGTGGNRTDANIGNANQPDVRSEAVDSVTDAATQYWRIQQKSGGGVTLLNKSGGRSASVWTGNATAGQRIGQWVDDRTDGTWDLVQESNGDIRLRSRQNNSLFLTGSTADAGVTLQTTVSDGAQSWQVVPQGQSAGNVKLTNVNSGLCADVWDYSSAERAAVNQGTCHAGQNQQWRVVPTGGSNVKIVNVQSSKCLEIYGRSTAQGAAATQYSCNGGTNQQWTRTAQPNGAVTFQNVNSGLCLEIGQFSRASGVPLVQYSCNGGTNQQWRAA